METHLVLRQAQGARPSSTAEEQGTMFRPESPLLATYRSKQQSSSAATRGSGQLPSCPDAETVLALLQGPIQGLMGTHTAACDLSPPKLDTIPTSG